MRRRIRTKGTEEAEEVVYTICYKKNGKDKGKITLNDYLKAYNKALDLLSQGYRVRVNQVEQKVQKVPAELGKGEPILYPGF